MRASDIMATDVLTVPEDASVADLCDVLQQAHANGAPVVNAEGVLVGVVTEEDVLYGSMGNAPGATASGEGTTLVRDIMTSPAVFATEDTDVVSLCKLMWQMRIHRIPIVQDGRVRGVVSAMDIVRAISEGRIPVRS